jgi:uncharacterized protein with FMN-binding domain
VLRGISAVAAPIVGLILLFSFKSHGGGLSMASAAGTTKGSGSAAGNASGSKGSGGSPGVSSQQAQINALIRQKEPNVPVGPAMKLAAGERTVNSASVQTAYGPVQIQLVVKGTKITAVQILVQPQATLHDLEIGELAFPTLIKDTLSQQNAKLNAVSGATYTSGGYIKSLQSAIDKMA